MHRWQQSARTTRCEAAASFITDFTERHPSPPRSLSPGVGHAQAAANGKDDSVRGSRDRLERDPPSSQTGGGWGSGGGGSAVASKGGGVERVGDLFRAKWGNRRAV